MKTPFLIPELGKAIPGMNKFYEQVTQVFKIGEQITKLKSYPFNY